MTDVPYVSGGGREQQLDLFLPARPSSTLVAFVHGGSLTGGDRADEDYRGVCEPLVAAGFPCATLNYRLFPFVKWPTPAQDVAAGVSWLKRNIASYGGRVDRLFLFGHSSGCLLVSLLGTDRRYLESAGMSLENLAGVIAMGCRLNDEIKPPIDLTPEHLSEHFRRDPYDAGFGTLDALNDAVPSRHVSAATPPFLVLIAEAEKIEPPILADAEAFRARAERAGARGRVRIVVLDRTKHLSALKNMAAGPSDPGLRAVLGFLGP